MQDGAAVVLWIERKRPLQRVDGTRAVAELRCGLAEREPGGGEGRLRLGRLREQVGGGGEVATRRQLAAEREAAVGNEIAG
jgi:hypothetical protein